MAIRIIGVLITAALLLGTTAAQAGVTCYRVGSYTYCDDDNTGQTTTCYRVGNYTYCD